MDFNEEVKLIYKQEIYAEWISRNMPSECERGGRVKIQSLNEKNRSSSVRVCASPPLKPVPLHLCPLLNFHWASAATKPICPSIYFAFGHDSLTVASKLIAHYTIFRHNLKECWYLRTHIITLLTSSSVILCWFWSLQITGKRTNNLLVIKLFNWAWLSAAPGSCWCCQLIFLLNPADLKCKPVLRWEPSWQPLLISCSADSVRGRCLACLRQRPTENLLLSTHPALGDLSRHAHQAKEKMCVWSIIYRC